MKLVHALALALTHSVVVVFSGVHGHNLRQDAGRDLVGEAPVLCGNVTKCNKRSTCVNDKCVCKPGWKEPQCINVNECKELDPPPCNFTGAVCVDEDPHLDGSPGGKYHCACKTKEGWINGPTFDEHGPLSCGDLNECSQDPSPCHPNATCTNLKPGFNCTCKDGFEGDGEVSCAVPTTKVPAVKPPKPNIAKDPCARCRNDNPTSFCDEASLKCKCREGFYSPSGLGGTCKGRDYCKEGLDNCASNAKCIPLEGEVDAGFFSCECNKGYITATGSRQGTVCVPHNECSDGTNNCESNEFCIDLSPPNTFKCVLVTDSPTPSPTTAAPTPAPTLSPCDGVTCTAQAKCNARTGICECNAGLSGNGKTKCLDPHTVTPNAIFGTGNANGAYTIARSQNGIEVGLRGKLRFNNAGQPENTFNYDGDHTYTFKAGNPLFNFDGTANASPPTSRAKWNVEWSVNSNYDGTTPGLKLSDLNVVLSADYDRAESLTNFLGGDPFATTGAFLGTSVTGNGGGTAVSHPIPAATLATKTVAQDSFNYGFAAGLPGVPAFDARLPGFYTIKLEVFNKANVLQTSVSIVIQVTNDLVTSNFIGGTGVTNGAFTITRKSGIEVGLRGKLRFNSIGQAENTFNYDGDHTYRFAPISYTPSTGGPQPVWSFDWSVNTDFDGTTGLKVDDLTYYLILDYDPAIPFARTGTSVRVAFDPITPPTPAGNPPDHSIGTSATSQSAGVETNDLQTYKNLIASNTLIQQSWRYGFFIPLVTPTPYAGFNPTVPGTFTIILTAFKAGVPVAETSINIVTTTP